MLTVLSACKSASITPMSVSGPSILSREPDVSDDNSGIVVIGQGLLWKDSILGVEFDHCKVFSTHWLPMDQNVPEQFSRGFTANNNGCPGDNTPPVAYNVLKIPPGRYALSKYVHHVFRNHLYVTNIFDESVRPKYEEARGPKFTIGKGEVVYIGDFYFAYLKPAKDSVLPSSQSHPKPVKWAKDEEAARKALGALGIDPDRMILKTPK